MCKSSEICYNMTIFMKKYWRVCLLAIQKHLAYRARIINWAIVDISHTMVFPFLWLSLYQNRSSVGGFSPQDIVTYYILTIFIGMCANSHISRYIQDDIVHGKMNQHLMHPVSYPAHRYFLEAGYRIFILPIFFLIFFLSSFFISDYVQLPHSLGAFFWFLFFLLCAHLIFFFIELIIGFTSFFIQETQSLTFLRQILEKLLGGAFAPLTFLPPLVQSIAHALPFQYLYFIPTQVYLGKIAGTAILHHALISAFWVIFLYAGVQLLWKKGLRRYDGGGV